MRWRPSTFDIRTSELRDLVRRSREVVLLAAVTGAITGLFVRFFEYLVVEVLFHVIVEAPLWVGALAPAVGLALSAILLRTLGNGASPATSDEYLRAFHDPEYPLRPGPSSAGWQRRSPRWDSAERWGWKVLRCTAGRRWAR